MMLKTLSLLTLSISALAMADTVELSSKDVVLPVDITTTRMVRSNAGYSAPVVKFLCRHLRMLLS